MDDHQDSVKGNLGLVTAPAMAVAMPHWSKAPTLGQHQKAGSPQVNLVVALLVVAMVLLSLPWFRLHLPEKRRTCVYLGTVVQAVALFSDLPDPGCVF
jgi:hypothetical protein